mmetsp:Transcript_26685/g.76543  ORF Transcript_26685/g.76543 Transcript_26685/m.76543 type:complete len:203 (+) Transcript_26685:1801-2409(+)
MEHCEEGDLLGVLPQCGQVAGHRRVRQLADERQLSPAPHECPLRRRLYTRLHCVPRSHPHHQGVHAQRHRDQTRVATRGRTPLLQGQRSRLRRQDAQGAQGVSNGGCKQRHLDGMEVGGRQTSLIRVCPRWLASMPSVWSSCLPAGCLSTSLCAHTHTHADGYGGWGECLDKRAWTLIRLSRYVWGGAPACLSVSINQSVCI